MKRLGPASSLLLGLAACGTGEAKSPCVTAATSATANAEGDAAANGVHKSGAGVVDSGAGGGAGAEEGFPWEGAIDPNGGSSSERLTARRLGTTTAPQGFYEYLPFGYPGEVGWPLLIALHGIGENGNGTTELDEILVTGIPKIIDDDQWPSERPFVVLMPQHPGGGCPGADEIQSFLAWSIEHYDIDPQHVYLTGLSCGAIGAWEYLSQHLDAQIAAFVPIAGNGKNAWNNRGCDLAKVAIWAFHGDADDTVDVSGTNVPMDGLAGCPAPPALETQKTIYPGVGHDSWNRTYDLSEGHDIYTWMLGFKRDQPHPETRHRSWFAASSPRDRVGR